MAPPQLGEDFIAFCFLNFCVYKERPFQGLIFKINIS
jgi:hypothetical protein